MKFNSIEDAIQNARLKPFMIPNLLKTRRGFPATSEEGGVFEIKNEDGSVVKTRGSSKIVCDKFGNPKRPIFKYYENTNYTKEPATPNANKTLLFKLRWNDLVVSTSYKLADIGDVTSKTYITLAIFKYYDDKFTPLKIFTLVFTKEQYPINGTSHVDVSNININTSIDNFLESNKMLYLKNAVKASINKAQLSENVPAFYLEEKIVE